MQEKRARELVAHERTRIEGALRELSAEISDEARQGRQQTGEYADGGSRLEAESVSVALADDLRRQLAAVGRAEERLASGTYGSSIESGLPIPDDRLEVEPLAERTIEEQRRHEMDPARRSSP